MSAAKTARRCGSAGMANRTVGRRQIVGADEHGVTQIEIDRACRAALANRGHVAKRVSPSEAFSRIAYTGQVAAAVGR